MDTSLYESSPHIPKLELKMLKNRQKANFRRFQLNKPESPSTITLNTIYYGKGINISYDKQLFGSKDEISIMQQHCGGENLTVFTGFLESGGKNYYIFY